MDFENAIEEWKRIGIQVNTGASNDLIQNIESDLQFKFPETFKELYQKMNGFKNWDYDDNMFSLMPLERILEEYKESPDKNFIPFCDYLINSHWIGFVRNNDGIYKNYELENKIASSFSEAIILIVSKSGLLY